MSKFLFVDTEYNRSKDEKMNVVCASMLSISGQRRETIDVWLEGDEEAKQAFRDTIEEFIREDYTFISFAVVAEGRALQSLGIDPRRIRWIDLMLEYRMLVNHNHREGCGKHLVDGKVKTLFPPVPKWERTEEDAKRNSSAAPVSLSSAIYKMLGLLIDTDRKDEMRNLIIAGGPFNDQEKKEIMEYCSSDVVHLPELFKKIHWSIKRKLQPKDQKLLRWEMYTRGDYAARSAIMEAVGYPIDYEATRNFSRSTPDILFEIQDEIVKAFPEIKAFEINKGGDKYRQKMKNIQSWVSKQGFDDWMKTEKGALSLSLEAFTKYFDFKHHYPKDNFGAQMVRLLKTKQSLNGFMPSGKRSFWEYVGADQRVRPYMGIYRAQSGRSQPASTGFIPLKAAWMRSLIVPEPGRAIVSIDYEQQEFLLAALLSKDHNMIKAYHSGDPYLATGKIARAIPKEATKATHGPLRDKFKSTVLGIQYMMGARGLAVKLEKDTGTPHTEEQAQDLIDKFEQAYPDYQEWKEEIWAQYRADGYLKLPCGWTMWGDNKNRRSVCNFPIQGLGSSIMREAVARAQDEGLDVIFTLHDALYVECASKDIVFTVNELAHAMDAAVAHYFKKTTLERFARCRLDPQIWSRDFPNKVFKTDIGEVLCTEIYVDKRSVEEYEQFKKYFEIDDLKLILSL